jgi:hypothetical protein
LWQRPFFIIDARGYGSRPSPGRRNAFPRRHAPEFCTEPSAQRKSEGVGNTGCPLHPWPRVQKVESTRVSTADTPGHPAFPHAMVLTVSFALSLVTGLVCHHRRRNEAPLRARLGKGAFRRLDASVGASGPHDFAVRQPHHSSARRLIAHRPCGLPCHHVLAPDEPASTASRPASVTIASRPSEGRDGEGYAGDLGEKRSGIFLQRGVDMRLTGSEPSNRLGTIGRIIRLALRCATKRSKVMEFCRSSKRNL